MIQGWESLLSNRPGSFVTILLAEASTVENRAWSPRLILEGLKAV